MGGGVSGMFTIAGGETQRQVLLRCAGTFSNLGALVSANTIATSATTVTFRKNAADGSQVVSIGAGLTGHFRDTSNSDTIASGDKVNLKVVTPATSGSLTFTGCTYDFAASSGTSGFFIGPMLSVASNGITRYGTWNGNNGQSAAEVNTQITTRSALTLRNLCVNVQTARAVVDTFTSRANTASGSLTVSTTASTTGFYEDTTHSHSIASGDAINYMAVWGASASTIVWLTSVQADFSGADRVLIANNATTAAAGSTNYHAAAGTTRVLSAETGVQAVQSLAGTYDRLYVNISTNATTATSTVRTRKNTANGGQSVSISSGATGSFEDTTNSDTVAVSDTFNLQSVVGTGGALTIACGSLRFTPTATNIDGTLTQTLGAATSTAAGTVDVQGTLTKTLGAATSTAAGTVAIAGTASVTLGAATTTATGTVAVAGALSKTLGAATISADGVVASGPTGSLSVTLGAATVSSSGTVAIAGDLSKTLGSATSTAAGAVAIVGALTKTLGAAAVTAAGIVAAPSGTTQTLADAAFYTADADEIYLLADRDPIYFEAQ